MHGGITTAAQLRRIADVTDKYNIPTVKVTGGQRIDLFGIKKEDLPTVRKQLKNYERMKLLMDRWIELATEWSNLRLIKEIVPKAAKT
jgi:dissimilatory sulfite reductase (desulfoviridin) alpha/beta subunit